MFTPMNHFGHTVFTSTPDELSNSDTKSELFRQGYYLSETRMERWKGPPQPSQECIPLVNIINPTTKVENPFDMEENHIRKHPVNLRGCYCCV